MLLRSDPLNSTGSCAPAARRDARLGRLRARARTGGMCVGSLCMFLHPVLTKDWTWTP